MTERKTNSENARVVAMLAFALLATAGAACQRFLVVPIDLDVPAGFTVARIEDHVEAAGYTHDGRSTVDASFKSNPVLGVYLPTDVEHFTVTVWVYSDDCRALKANASLDVGGPRPRLALSSPAEAECPDAGAEHADGGGVEVTADSGADEGGPDAGVDADHADCDSDGGVSVPACFDPATDPGPPDPVALNPLDPGCDHYCATDTAVCADPFPDAATCRIVCTAAGWAGAAADAGAGGVVLACLTGWAEEAAVDVAGRVEDCGSANPVFSPGCEPGCPTYCALWETLCGDDPAGPSSCLTQCAQLTRSQLSCLLGVLMRDVPGDRRFCSWARIDLSCIRC